MHVFWGPITENDTCFTHQILVFKMIEYFKKLTQPRVC